MYHYVVQLLADTSRCQALCHVGVQEASDHSLQLCPALILMPTARWRKRHLWVH